MEIHNNAPVNEAYALRHFPNIDIEGFKVTSELDFFYNCFAWAGEDNTRNWEPGSRYSHWLTDNPAYTLENFIDNYSRIGYTELTKSSALESDYEKIVIYVNDDGIPTHAARQLESGKWTSKLGIREDIEHSTPECIESDEYGVIKVILKRPNKQKYSNKTQETSKEFEKFKNLAKGIANVPKKEIDNAEKVKKEEN
ncbi:MAG: hypothetical protein M3405_14745 [Acidobacteriota bacterium]|jgi:hypothetical protein|nr:hypothetical protein [Acidobacteriota bacterium]